MISLAKLVLELHSSSLLSQDMQLIVAEFSEYFWIPHLFKITNKIYTSK